MNIGELTKALQTVVDSVQLSRDYDVDALRGWCEEQAVNPDQGRIRQETFKNLAGVLRAQLELMAETASDRAGNYDY